MRRTGLLILGLMIALAGCASEPAPQPPVARYYAPASAAALAFEPPLLAYGPVPEFPRQGRSPGAFYGFEQTTTEGLYLHQRDTVRGDRFPDYFDRTARATRSTITYR